MKKRGSFIALWFLMELVAGVFLGFSIVKLSLDLSTGVIYEKINVARDISIQINTLASVPGDAYFVIEDLHGFSLKIKDNKVEVFEDPSDFSKGSSYFVQSQDSNLDFTLENSEELSKQIIISKVDNQITISENTNNPE